MASEKIDLTREARKHIFRKRLEKEGHKRFVEYIIEETKKFEEKRDMWLEVLIEEPKTLASIRLKEAWEEFTKEYPEKEDRDPIAYCDTLGFQVWLYHKGYKLDLLNSPLWTER